MFRHIAIFMVGAAAIANLNAGSVTLIGGNSGLTSTIGITTSGFVESAYAGTLLTGTGATVTESGSGVLCAGNTTATCTATTGIPNGEQTISTPPGNEFATANGVTFAMIDQPTTTQAVWAAPNTGTNSVTIPIGIFGVTNVDTMLNDQYGVNGAQTTTVQFNFSNSTSETFTLTDGTVIRDDFNCTGGSGLATCQSFNYATALNTTNGYGINGTSLGTLGTIASGTAYVSAFNVWNGTYGSGSGHYANTTGNINFDAQNFSLGSMAAGTTLVSITIQDAAGSTAQVSRDALTAITVVAAPEPSTVFLVLFGIAAMAFSRRFAKQS
jgi:hypothetical protein